MSSSLANSILAKELEDTGNITGGGGGSTLLLCVALATFTGFAYTAGVAATALPTFLIEKKGRQVTNGQSLLMTVAYVLLCAIANGPLILACSYGPVAVVVPVAIGSYMLSNMVLQIVFGMAFYTKQMRIGTMVLALAAVMLVDVGPATATEEIDAMEMLKATSSIVWLCIAGSLVLLGLVLIMLTKSRGPNSFLKIVAFTLVVGCQAALNNTLSKLMSCTEGNVWYAVTAGFLLGSVISGGASGMACTGTNCAVSVPLMSCMQVLVNGLSGVFIWGDAARISTPLAYVFVYVYFFLGIYLTSTADLEMIFIRWSKLHKVKHILTDDIASDLGKSMQTFWQSVKSGCDGVTKPGELEASFRRYVEQARKTHTMTNEFDELALQVVRVASAKGCDKDMSRLVTVWLSEHSDNFAFLLEHDAEFAAEVAELSKKHADAAGDGNDLKTGLLSSV